MVGHLVRSPFPFSSVHSLLLQQAVVVATSHAHVLSINNPSGTMNEEEVTDLEAYRWSDDPNVLPIKETEKRNEHNDEEVPEEKIDYMTLAKAGGRKGTQCMLSRAPATPIRSDFHSRPPPALRVRGSVRRTCLLPLGGLVRSRACSW